MSRPADALRHEHDEWCWIGCPGHPDREPTDRILAENKRLREALEGLVAFSRAATFDEVDGEREVYDKAREALAQSETRATEGGAGGRESRLKDRGGLPGYPKPSIPPESPGEDRATDG